MNISINIIFMDSLKIPVTLNEGLTVAVKSKGQTHTVGMPFGHE